MARMFRSSRVVHPLVPQSNRDAVYRHLSHGPIIPLERPTLLERLFGWR